MAGKFARAVIVVLLATTVSCRGGGRGREGAGGPARARDLIVVTIDTLRADRLGIAGGPPDVTPGLDGLGREGAVFLDATAHAPLTLPSHSSIFTGRYPPGHGVHDNSGFALAPGVPTLAAILHEAGYHTAAFVSSFVLRGSTGLARGFDLYDDRFEEAGRAHQIASALERRAPEVAREAARWLADAPRPYFLWVHFYDPHAPYDAPAAFAARFPGRPYDAEVATSDFGVSMLLQALPASRRAATVIVATGDHGESLGEHGESEHGILLYDSTLHVPLIVAGPGVAAGIRVERQVRHVDLLPTIAELLGVKPPGGLDGVSLVPLVSALNGHAIPIRSTSDRHPQTIRSTPDQHPQGIRSTSDSHPQAIRSASDQHPQTIRSSSDQHPQTIRRASDRHPQGIRSTSDRHPQTIRSSFDQHPQTIHRASDRHPQTIRRASDQHPQGIRRASDQHPQGIRSTSDSHPQTIRSTSGRHLQTVRSASDQHPQTIRSTSDWHPQDIRSTSDAHSAQKVPMDPPASYAESRFGELHFGWAPLRSVRDGSWKYIDGAAPELFHLSIDPGERDDRHAARADTAAGMARVLTDLVARGGASSPARATADAEAAERLRSLGYLSGRVSLDGRDGAGHDVAAKDPRREIARYEAYVSRFNDGLASLESGRAREAETIFRRLAHDFPLAFEPHQYLARALAARRAFADAVAEFERAIRLSPREPVLYFDEARTLADGGQFDRAFARVAEGRTFEPASYYGALTEGLVARAAGRTDRAEKAFQEAIRMNPTLAVAHLELGEMAESRGDGDMARREYQRALDGDSTLAAARQALDRIGR